MWKRWPEVFTCTRQVENEQMPCDCHHDVVIVPVPNPHDVGDHTVASTGPAAKGEVSRDSKVETGS